MIMQNQVTTMPTATAAPAYAATDATANIAMMILQASNNPDIDVDKIEKMYQLYNAEAARLAELEFSKDLIAMQGDITPIATDASFSESNNSNNGNAPRYLSYEKMVAVTKPILTKHGFSLHHEEKTEILGQGQAKNGATIFNGLVTVTAFLRHKTGKFLTTSLTIPFDFSGSKNSNTAQAQGSAVSYGRRYTMAGLLKISTFDDDANFNKSNQLVKITDRQADTINEIYGGLSDQAKVNYNEQLKAAGVNGIDDIPKSWYSHFHTIALGLASQNQLTNQGAANAN